MLSGWCKLTMHEYKLATNVGSLSQMNAETLKECLPTLPFGNMYGSFPCTLPMQGHSFMGLQYTYPSCGHAIIHVHLAGLLLYFLWKYPCPSPAGLMTSFMNPSWTVIVLWHDIILWVSLCVTANYMFYRQRQRVSRQFKEEVEAEDGDRGSPKQPI